VVSICEVRRIQALQQIRQLRRQFHPEPVRVPRLPGRVAVRTYWVEFGEAATAG